MIKYVSRNSSLFEEFERGTVEDVKWFINSNEFVECDTETSGLDCHSNKLLTIQFGNRDLQYVVDLTTIDIQEFKEELESLNTTFIFHNAKFDLKFLYKQDIWPNKIYDTMLVEVILHKGLDYFSDEEFEKLWAKGVLKKKSKRRKYSLDVLALKYLDIVLDKTIRSDINRLGLVPSVIEYAAKDVEILSLIRKKQLKRCEKLDILGDVKLQNEFVKALAYIEFCGIYLNVDKWKEKCKKDKVKRANLEQELNKILISNFPEYKQTQLDLFKSVEEDSIINWNSSKQLIPIFQKFGVNTSITDKKTGKNKDSIDKKVLKSQKDIHPIVSKYIEYSESTKKVTSFGENVLEYINPVTGRLHPSYWQIINTGRMSSGGSGSLNIQQIPGDETRECFTAEKGNKLVVSDYSGQETMVLAHYSQDKEYLDYISNPKKDIHCLNASLLFDECKNIPHKEIKEKYPKLRYEAKNKMTFAINYGGDANTIATGLGISKEKAEEAYQGFLNNFPNLKEYWNRTKKETLNRGYILIDPVIKAKTFIANFDKFKEKQDIINRPGFWDEYKLNKEKLRPFVRDYFKMRGSIERNALNYPIQGTSSHQTKLATIKIFNYIKNKGLLDIVKIVLNLHDEIATEQPENLSEEMKRVVNIKMLEAAHYFCPSVKFNASTVISNYWTH